MKIIRPLVVTVSFAAIGLLSLSPSRAGTAEPAPSSSGGGGGCCGGEEEEPPATDPALEQQSYKCGPNTHLVGNECISNPVKTPVQPLKPSGNN